MHEIKSTEGEGDGKGVGVKMGESEGKWAVESFRGGWEEGGKR